MTLQAPPAPRARVLVVDDELGPRESLRMLLKPLYTVETAESGRVALEQLPQVRPDLVILDIKMPDMDGLEVLRRIKAADPSIEVVMITAYASLETVKLALSRGAFEYLIKPFTRQDIEDVLRRALLRRQSDLGARGQIAALVEEMRSLATKTRELEEAARREAAEQSLRVTQLSILREIARTITGNLDLKEVTRTVAHQVRTELGYDHVTITVDGQPLSETTTPTLVVCAIRDAEGLLGHLVVDNRPSGRPIDPLERHLLELLAEYLAVAVRNSRLYGEVADTKRSLEQVVASAGEGIIAVGADQTVQGWNPAAEQIFGIAAPAVIGRPVETLLPGAEFAEARARLASGEDTVSFETRLPAPEPGRPRTLAVTLSALRGPQDASRGLIAIVRDITVQREVESQLHQSEKLTALGQLAGGIAHDFNNLLQAILGYSQLMKQNMDDGELTRRSVRIIENAALDGSETVRRIQQFARLRPEEQFVAVDLNQIVRDAVAMTRPRWAEKMTHERRHLDLRVEAGSLPAVSGRPAALTEMMTNLILNAIDAMPDGGTLSIRTRNDQDRQVVLTVADTGTGMPESVRRRIFEPFFSTKGERGSGLGLAMTYSIVKRHGGDIQVESEAGLGTTFTIALPAATRRVETTPPPPSEEPHRAARVLVVDDEPQVLATLTELLRSRGHEVSPCPSGSAALAAYAPGRFDVVLSNLGMVGMNGWELAERIRGLDPGIAILFITGWGLKDEDQARLIGLGIHRCLFKPVLPADLDASIQSALRAT